MSENNLNPDDYYYSNFIYGEDFFEGILKWTGEVPPRNDSEMYKGDSVYLFEIISTIDTNINDWKEGWTFYLPTSDLTINIGPNFDLEDFQNNYPELFI